MITKRDIKEFAQSIGFDVAGFASAEPLEAAERELEKWVARGFHGGMRYLADYKNRLARLKAEIPDAKTIIVFGVNYFTERAMDKRAGPDVLGRVARYAWGKDYHLVIRERLKQVENFIVSRTGPPKSEGCADSNLRGGRAGNGTKCLACVDTQPILERSYAERAGLGFRGKQTNLLNRDYGPWLFLAEVLTNVEFESDSPEFHGTCGSCTACIDVCPTGAILESNEIDARRCISYLTIEHKEAIPRELRPLMKDWVFGCDECLNVCPFTRHSKESRWGEFCEEAGVGSKLDLRSLFKLRSNKEYQRRFQGTPLLRASRKMMLRNAAVVAGNLKDEGAVPHLGNALRRESPLVRQHAAWALGEIGGVVAREALSEAMRNEQDPEVCEEIATALGKQAYSPFAKGGETFR